MAQVSIEEATNTLKLWYRDRKEVSDWQNFQKKLSGEKCEVYTLLGRLCHFPKLTTHGSSKKEKLTDNGSSKEEKFTDHGQRRLL